MKRITLLAPLVAFTALALVMGGLAACAANGDANPSDVGDAGNTKKRDASKDTGTDEPGDDDDIDEPGDDDSGPGDEDGGDDAGEAEDTGTDAPVVTGTVWNSPVADGTIGAGEYGAGNSFTTKENQIWSLTWDGTNLYIAETSANVAEAIVFYIGFDGTGLSTGQTYDETRANSLSFKADAVIYAKSTYNEVRRVTGGDWTAPTASAVTFKGTGTTREIVVPWSVLGRAVIPGQFRFAAYNVSSTNFVYGQVPETNPGGKIGLTAVFPDNYFVSSTANGTGSLPFATVE